MEQWKAGLDANIGVRIAAKEWQMIKALRNDKSEIILMWVERLFKKILTEDLHEFLNKDTEEYNKQNFCRWSKITLCSKRSG